MTLRRAMRMPSACTSIVIRFADHVRLRRSDSIRATVRPGGRRLPVWRRRPAGQAEYPEPAIAVDPLRGTLPPDPHPSGHVGDRTMPAPSDETTTALDRQRGVTVCDTGRALAVRRTSNLTVLILPPQDLSPSPGLHPKPQQPPRPTTLDTARSTKSPSSPPHPPDRQHHFMSSFLRIMFPPVQARTISRQFVISGTARIEIVHTQVNRTETVRSIVATASFPHL